MDDDKRTITAELASSAPREENMLRRDFLKSALATAVVAKAFPGQSRETLATSNAKFSDVNGQHIFYSVHGTDKPLILIFQSE